ncbi:MAG: hypothetical protein ACXVHB_09720 [Solirubrobacteraceae bacterium]
MIRSATKFASILAATAAVGISAPASAAPAYAVAPPRAFAAKSCSSYTRAVINGSVKCLRAGEFCTHSADRQYRHYGFRCVRYYRNVGRYRLTYA